MSLHGPMFFDIALSGNRYLRPGENYQFSLKINHLILNYVYVNEINTIQILLKDYSNFAEDLFFELPINRTQKEFDITRSRSVYLPWICLLWRLEIF